MAAVGRFEMTNDAKEERTSQRRMRVRKEDGAGSMQLGAARDGKREQVLLAMADALEDILRAEGRSAA